MKRRRILYCCVAMTLLALVWSAFAESKSASAVQSISALKRQAESGDAKAQARLGYSYFSGRGVPKNYAQAEVWWRKAADQGDANAQYNLGALYDQGRG